VRNRAIRLAAHASIRTMRRPIVALAIVIGLTAGVVIAAVGSAATVAGAYDRLLAETDAFDAVMSCDAPCDPHQRAADVAAIDGIAHVGLLEVLDPILMTSGDRPTVLGPSADERCFTGAGDVGGIVSEGGFRSSSAPKMRYVDGRPPRSARDIALPRVTARRAGLSVGDTVELAGWCDADSTDVMLEDPIELTVSGIGIGPLDAAAGGSNGYLEIVLLSSAAIDDLRARDVGTKLFPALWYEPGVARDELAAPRQDLASGVVIDVQQLREAVRADLGPDAASLRVLAGLLALAAFVVLGQLLGNHVRIAGEDHPTLRAIGMTRRDLFRVGLLHASVIGAASAVVALVGSVLVWSRVPLGRADRIETVDVFDLHPVARGMGMAGTFVAVLAIAAGPAWIAAARRRDGTLGARPSTAATIVRALHLGPGAATGVRLALEPGRGTRSVPLRSGLGAATVAVAVICGAGTMSGGLEHLRETPRLVGWGWDGFGYLGDADVDALTDRLGREPTVEGFSTGTFFAPYGFTLGTERIVSYPLSFAPGRGAVGPVTTAGRPPSGDDEILLAPDLADRLGVAIGDEVEAHVPTIQSALATYLGQTLPDDVLTDIVTPLEVVGLGVLPVGDGRIDIGSAMTTDGLFATLGSVTKAQVLEVIRSADPAIVGQMFGDAVAALPPEEVVDHLAALPEEELIALSAPAPAPEIVVVDVAGGPRAVAKLGADLGAEGLLDPDAFTYDVDPAKLVSLDLARITRVPDAFAGLMLAVAGAVLAMLVITGPRARRRELAVLRVIGFRPRQVRWTVIAQAVTIAILALAVGMPLGVAGGRFAWRRYAEGLGVVPEPVVPVADIAIMAAAITALAAVIAVLPAVLAARRRPAALLRAE
jgi:ABC-type lipoprotein release transport system permease subunit